MKIYFAGSIRGGREDQEFYFSIIEELTKYGTVLTEHIGGKQLTDKGEIVNSDEYIYTRDMEWVKEADIIVAEVTKPSLGVGYEIGQAHAMGKRILCLYRNLEGKRLSAMIAGNASLEVCEYVSVDDTAKIFRDKLSV